ncbi:MAG: SDR family oxidoreductase [Vicinamibacteria bacterium]|nr:SDR family oxidoreductase [Vicinamibacteria bacterium]
MIMELNRPNALVTGASGGIGYELGREFARNGFDLALVARNQARLAEVARELEGQFDIRAVILPADLSDPEAPAELFRETQRRSMAVDALVNNAGFGDSGAFAACDWEIQRQMMQLNIVSLVQLTRLFLPVMLERRKGRILNVGSTASFAPVPNMCVYGATKAFVLSFSDALRAELQGTGVTVTALCPGVTSTRFAERAKTENALLVRFGGMTAADVARAGYDALAKGKARVVPGWLNRLMIASLRLGSRNTVTRLSGRLMRTPRSPGNGA